MRSGIAQGEDGAPGVTRRVVRLLVLLGAAFAAYLVLSLFDHAARADAGSINHIGATDSIKATVVGARTAIPEPKSIIPKSTAPKAHPQGIRRPTIKTPEVQPPKVQTAKKIHAPKIQVPSIPAGQTVRRVQVRTAIARPRLSTPVQLPSLPELAELPDLPQAALAALPPLPSWPQLPSLPLARTPVLNRTTALPSAMPHPPLMPPVSAQVCPLPQPPACAPASGLSGVTKPPAAPAQSRKAPLPAPPRQPADRSTTTGQARDSGGGNAPATGTVSLSWRPEVAATGRRLASDLIARGRTIRYAGPPS